MGSTSSKDGIQAVAIWIILCATLSAAGWLLSAIGELNSTGYLGVILLSLGGWGWVARSRRLAPATHLTPQRSDKGSPPFFRRRRFCRPLPALFLFISALILVSGLLYLPTNYDALTYRIPRTLHWLIQGHWHWITSTLDPRLNVMALGQEWLFAPVLAITHSTRPLFLYNFIPFLLLPGLIFATFRQLGIAPRVAWYWMWLLPTAGYCFALQAGSIGNDSYTALFALAAIYYPLRARHTRAISDLWIGALAAALLTGSKTTNVPLLLCFCIALWPARHLLRQRRLATTAVALLCILVSFIPSALLNQRYLGDWQGTSAFTGTEQHHTTDPIMGIAGNALQLLVANAIPPIIPFTDAWNTKAEALFATTLKPIRDHFPRVSLHIPQMLAEESSGLGSSLCALLLVTFAATLLMKRQASPPSTLKNPQSAKSVNLLGWSIAAASWIALFVTMAKVGTEAGPRIIAPYYPLCVTLLLLLPVNTLLTRKKLWQKLALGCALLPIPIIILQPARPLWPAQTAIQQLKISNPDNPMVARLDRVYSVYRQRGTVFNSFRPQIPAETKQIGTITTGDVNMTSLWYPIGQRYIHELSPQNEAKLLSQYGINIILATENGTQFRYQKTAKEWIAEHNGRVITEKEIIFKASGVTTSGYLVELPSLSSAPSP